MAEKKIGDVRFIVSKIPPKRFLHSFRRIAPIAQPIIIAAMKSKRTGAKAIPPTTAPTDGVDEVTTALASVDVSSIESIIDAVVAGLSSTSDANFDALLDDLMATTIALVPNGAGGVDKFELGAPGAFDAVFNDRLELMPQWIAFAVGETFGPFLRGLAQK